MLLKRIVFTVVFVLTSHSLFAASFNCSKATPGMEQEICADTQLSKADENLAKYYLKLKNSLDKKRSKGLLREQRVWLKQRSNLCKSGDVSCLKKLYSDRINVLRSKYENLVPFTLGDSYDFYGLRGTCGFADVKFPEEFVIYAAGWYAGRKLDIQIDQSGSEATRFDIIVNSPDKPVVLILGAYEPSIWNISWTKETVILAVVATGYRRQAVIGLPKDTPVLISSADNGGLCGHVYPDGKNQKQIDEFSNKLFNKPPNMVYLVGGGKSVLGSPLKQNEQLFSSADITIENIIDKKSPLAGPAGLKEALRKGILRVATQDDRETWIRLKTRDVYKKSNKKDQDPVTAGIQPITPASPDEFYVILKPFHMPNGLHGGLAADFFLLKGVPYPTGDIGSCHIYDFNTMKCHGPVCDQH